MSPSLEKIRDEIRHLPFAERVRFVKVLEDDLDTDEEGAEEEIEAAWNAEEQSRVDQITQGSVQLLTMSDLTARLDAVRARNTA